MTLASAPLMAANILLVLSEQTPAYQAYAQGFRTSLEPRSNATIEVLDLAQLGEQNIPDANVVIAVGSRAAEVMASKDLRPPLLLSMLPRATLDRLLVQQPRAGGVYIDQPPSRYIKLVRSALPDAEHIGLFAGRDSKDSAARLLSAAHDAKLRAQVEPITSEADIYPAMQKLFSEGGVLLATPDGTVFNTQTIPSILLSAYRRRVPVIGFSPAYIAAGAMVALYSTPEQIAAQSADISLQVLAGHPMPSPQYPRFYTIGTNERVARSLGFTLDTSSVITERLERLERQQ